MNLYGCNGDGGKTTTAGTPFFYVIPPAPDKAGKSFAIYCDYKDGGAVETLTFMRSLGRTTANGANAAAQPVLNLVGQPGPTGDGIAANDYICVRELDKITRYYQVSSVSTLQLTLTTNLTKGTNGGEDVWMMGTTGDTDPRSGSTHPAYPSGSSSSDTIFPLNNSNPDAVIVGTYAIDEPILLNINSVSFNGTLKLLSWGYANP